MKYWLFILFVCSGLSLRVYGEELDFRIRYGFITVGHARFVTSEAELDGRPVFHTQVVAQTTGLASRLYPLYDIYESFYDKAGYFPYLSVQDRREGKYTYYDKVDYFQDSGYVVSERRDTVLSMPKSPSFDVVSAIYSFRQMDWTQLEVDDVVEIPAFHGTAFFPIQVVYKGRETVQAGGTDYDCHKFIPLMDSDKVLQKKESMAIWFSADSRKIPVCIRFNLLLGAYRVELE